MDPVVRPEDCTQSANPKSIDPVSMIHMISTLSRRKLIIALPIVAGLGLLAVAFWVNPHGSNGGAPTKVAPPIAIPPGADERAECVKKFLDKNGPEVDARISEALKRDPSYYKSIITVDEQSIRSLKGLSEAEKDQIWRMMQAAQENARKQGPPRPKEPATGR